MNEKDEEEYNVLYDEYSTGYIVKFNNTGTYYKEDALIIYSKEDILNCIF